MNEKIHNGKHREAERQQYGPLCKIIIIVVADQAPKGGGAERQIGVGLGLPQIDGKGIGKTSPAQQRRNGDAHKSGWKYPNVPKPDHLAYQQKGQNGQKKNRLKLKTQGQGKEQVALP